MLVTSKQMILDAKRGGYAVGCFNTSDLEITKAIIKAAEAQLSPVMVATSEKAIQYGGIETLAALIRQEAENAKVPVALHLDHGKSLHIVKVCLEAGYTSVMIDGSDMLLGENIALTHQAAMMAHVADVPCEGELGALGKAGKSESQFTNPEDVLEFVKKTEVDFLAISIGSSHGVADDEKLNLNLLNQIKAFTDIPLVLHGGSGIPDNDVKKVIANGICKVNIDTDIRHEFTKDLREVLKDHPEEQDPREILEEVMVGVQNLVERKIKLFGSNNKA
ncbi:MAG: class II fructose-bisphosphate aldolase [Patescibacteria group bacterium]